MITRVFKNPKPQVQQLNTTAKKSKRDIYGPFKQFPTSMRTRPPRCIYHKHKHGHAETKMEIIVVEPVVAAVVAAAAAVAA